MVTKTVIPTDITKLKNESLNKNNNLSDLADRAAAWLNVRPIGSTPLAGDPVNDYDAVTKRWVENKINTGTVGPTMNGVMNYGVGDFHLRDSRAYIQPYEVFSDGQLLNRADWPELWAYAQMLTPISDAEWLADASKRGKYSLGNGTTTFRVPDRNGVQPGSIQALFGRGDGGNSPSNGVVSESGAPNITYAAPHTVVTLASLASQVATNGALQSITSGDAPAAVGSGSRYIQTNFDASRCSHVYGRSAAEIVPRNFVGVWVIRASGGFVAANTSWSVMNADAVRPGSGVKALSGQVKAQYKIGTVVEADAGLRCDAYMDGTYYAILSVYNKTKGVSKDLAFSDGGTLSSDRYSARFGTLMGWSETGSMRGTFSVEDQNIGTNYAFNSIVSASQANNNGYKTTTHLGMIHFNNTSFAQSCWQVAGDANTGYGVRLSIQPLNDSIWFNKWEPGTSETYTLQKNATSDRRLKHSIEDTTVEKALENIKNLNFVTFIYNNDNLQRTRRGVIAQETEVIEPLYVKTRKFYDNSGIEQEQKELDTTPMLLDTMHVVQDLIKRIEDLEEELKQLRANLVQ